MNEKQVTTSDTNFVVVDRGETLKVDIWVDGEGAGSVENDVRVRAWVGGYEYGEIAEKTEVFKVESDGSYHRTLYLEVSMKFHEESILLHRHWYGEVAYVQQPTPLPH